MKQAIRVVINGYGRIGRCALRALYESEPQGNIEVVAINEPADLPTMVYLTKYDSTHGVFNGSVEQSANGLCINGRNIPVYHSSKPEAGPWRELEFDLLWECSGAFSTRAGLEGFLDAGCPRVLVSQPAHSAQDVDYTVVYGTNESGLQAGQRIVSAASCTTNAIVPVLDVLDRSLGVDRAYLTTLHSVMNDQPMIDGYHHADLRRTRSAMQSIIPVATGLAQGVERLLPRLAGRIQAKAVRVPILNVSAIDLMVNLREAADVTRLNGILETAAALHPALLACSNHPHASIDFNHDPHSAIIDTSQTRVNGDHFANLFIWFDNEWGFAHRMLDVTQAWAATFAESSTRTTRPGQNTHYHHQGV
ncbi:erythrose-4-phosphate dehydrogenase [Alcaligenaceae bacterium CGII-47]|nr:erythrose-4-phosphate dehydrogenase [Alcaligenaceae bacterium CGII-47]